MAEPTQKELLNNNPNRSKKVKSYQISMVVTRRSARIIISCHQYQERVPFNGCFHQASRLEPRVPWSPETPPRDLPRLPGPRRARYMYIDQRWGLWLFAQRVQVSLWYILRTPKYPISIYHNDTWTLSVGFLFIMSLCTSFKKIGRRLRSM